MTSVSTGRYSRAHAFLKFSTLLPRHGWYIDPATNESTFLEFTKIHDHARNRKTARQDDIDSYLYTSNLADTVVIDALRLERRKYYESESEDDFCTTGPHPDEPKRVSYHFTLAVKFSPARFTLVAQASHTPLPSPQAHEVPDAESEYADIEDRVYRRLGMW